MTAIDEQAPNSLAFTPDELQRFTLQLAEASGEAGITADDLKNAHNEFEAMVIGSVIVDLWRSGDFTVSWNPTTAELGFTAVLKGEPSDAEQAQR